MGHLMCAGPLFIFVWLDSGQMQASVDGGHWSTGLCLCGPDVSQETPERKP